MFGQDQKPAETKSCGIGGINSGVEDIEPGEAQDVKRFARAAADLWRKQSEQDEAYDGIEVHGQLQRG